MKYFRHLFLFVLALLPTALAAQETSVPNIVMKSKANSIYLRLAGSVEEIKFKVDAGDGKLTEYTLPTDETIDFTVKPVGADKPVKIYDVGDNIEFFYAGASELTELTFTDCPKMKWIQFSHNNIDEIDITQMPELLALNASYNNLTRVDISKCPKLQILNLKQNANLENMSLATCPDLEYVDFDDNRKISNVDVSMLPKLYHLGCSWTAINRLDVTKNPELKYLSCGYIQYLSQIDLTKNTKLEQLYISTKIPGFNRLNQLDVTNCPELKELFCMGHNLKTLDVTKNPKLQSLFCSTNELTELDLSNNPEIIELSVYSNHLPYNTLPVPTDNPQIGLYYYDPMNDIFIDDIEYAVNSKLDLADRTYSEKHPTTYSLILTDSMDPTVETKLTEGVDFSVDKGVITFLKEQGDSVFVSMRNPGFPGVPQHTSKFMIRKAEDLGKNSLAFEYTTSKEIGTSGSVNMAAYTPNSKVYIDWGDGEFQKYTINTYINDRYGRPQSGTIKGDRIKVYTAKGVQIKELRVPGSQVTSIDLSKSHALQTLNLSRNELTEINFDGNLKLQTVNVENNKLKEIKFIRHYELLNVYANSNELENVDLGKSRGLKQLKVSNNNLKSISLWGHDCLEILEANFNQLEELNVGDCAPLTDLRLRGNNLTSLDLSNNTNLNIVWLEDNKFKFSTMPKSTSRNFSYSSQKAVEIPAGSFMVDLSSEYQVDGNTTSYLLKTSDGQRLFEDEDYTLSNGIITFSSTDYDNVYCEMKNDTWPALTLKTTEVKPMGKPDMEMVSMKVKEDAGTPITLSLGTTKDDYVYIDFGDGDLRYANLHYDYSLVKGALGKSKEIKIFTYKEFPASMRVFSPQGVALSEIDLSNMPDLECLNLGDAYLKSVDISHNLKLDQLTLSNNRLSSLDLSKHKALTLLNLANSGLKDVDLSNQTELTWLSLNNMGLEKIDLSKLSKLKWLSLKNNKLTEIDLSAQKELRELSLAGNLFESINLDNQPDMAVVDITDNRFKFSTFPYHTINILYYNNQADVEVEARNGSVDLSSENVVNDKKTDYKWFTESGTELIEGTDYTIKDGVTTFAKIPEEKVVCEMTNSFFPALVIKTVAIDLNKEGSIDSVEIGADALVNVYDLSGTCLMSFTGDKERLGALAPGFYIVETVSGNDRTVSKIHIK